MEQALTFPSESRQSDAFAIHAKGLQNTSAAGIAASSTQPLALTWRLQISENLPGSALCWTNDGKQKLNNQCELYRCYARYLPTLDGSSPACNVAARAQQIMRELEEMIVAMNKAAVQKIIDLQHCTDQFRNAVIASAGPYWYSRCDDLVEYCHQDFRDCIQKMPTPDIRDFSSYLIRTLTYRVKCCGSDDEYGTASFMSKTYILLDKIVRESVIDYSIALEFCVMIKTMILHTNQNRVPHWSLRQEHTHIDEKIIWLLERHSEQVSRQHFWNFAAVWRALLVDTAQVSAQNLESLLGVLQIVRSKAEDEIRSRVRIAIGGRLPEDLLETVLENAMLVEEVPQERDL